MALEKLKTVCTNTADAIRELAGTNDKIKPSNFCDYLRNKCKPETIPEYDGTVVIE